MCGLPKLFDDCSHQTTIILNFKRATFAEVVLFLFSDTYFIMEYFRIQHIFLFFFLEKNHCLYKTNILVCKLVNCRLFNWTKNL